MSYEYEENEHYEEDDYLLEQEVEEIQAEYQRKKLIESLIGPGVSTVFHVILIIILAILIIPSSKQEPADIEVTLLVEEPPVVIPPEPEDPIVDPEKTDIKSTEISIQLPNPYSE